MKHAIAYLTMGLILVFISVSLIAQDTTATPDDSASTAPTLVPTDPQPPAGSNAEAGTTTSSLDAGSGSLAMSLKSLDFTDAQLSLAGPSALYIRGVKIEGSKASLLFRKGDQDQWKLMEMIPEDKNFFPQGLVLDFARLSNLEDGSLEIDGIILDGRPYRTTIQLNDDNSLSFNQPLQAGSFVGTSVTRAKPAAQLALKEELQKLDETERLNQEMLAKIGNLDGSDRTLSEENLKLQDQVKELTDRKMALDNEVSALKTEVEQLRAGNGSDSSSNRTTVTADSTNRSSTDAAVTRSLDLLISSIDKLSAKVAEMDQKLEKVSSRTALASTGTSGNSGSTDLLALQDEIERLTDLNQKLMNERQDIEQKLRAQYVASAYIQVMKPLMKTVALTGFSQAISKVGSWDVTESKAVQSDSGQYFAQLHLPLIQKNVAMLYSFDAKSTAAGWAGLGLHLYAQDSTHRGYGHGQSLLVWLTRDPDYYRNDSTYLQLYKSDDDINMGRVLDSAIQEAVTDELHVDVLYQPAEEYLTVSINGVEKIRYKTWFGIDSGVEIALRSLNSAEFSNLEVRTIGTN